MKELFVPYELAVKLMEKGCRPNTLGVIYPDNELFTGGEDWSKIMIRYAPEARLAIMYQQAIDWLRGKGVRIIESDRVITDDQWIVKPDGAYKTGAYKTKAEAIEGALKLI